MAVTIENQSGVTFTFQDGDPQIIVAEVMSEIEQMGLTGTTYSSAILADYEGVRKVITIEGALTPATSTTTDTGETKTIAEQKTWLEGLQSGLQLPKTFTASYEAEEVMVAKVRTEEHAGIPNFLPFQIILFVGGL